ncbi:hypothetical protein [Leeuwenhoekiella aequorea]|uniref:DUF3137 domain-containing protein n=2 Tax=Flavobacteriia TaxID=117743 RepID=A0A4Q0PC32_9FLAO|nr:hypothetical protein [Leeuwenhoekiella aequorea]RXG24307.1 hypothetical protein DSM00_93 [Leeuwenhoekiella aequorea]CCF99583.1 membrane protein [uncultured Flavobacteriia bacterium]
MLENSIIYYVRILTKIENKLKLLFEPGFRMKPSKLFNRFVFIFLGISLFTFLLLIFNGASWNISLIVAIVFFLFGVSALFHKRALFVKNEMNVEPIFQFIKNRNIDFHFLKMNKGESDQFLRILEGKEVSKKVVFKITSTTRPKDPHYNAIFSIFDLLIVGGVQSLEGNKKKAFFQLIDHTFLMGKNAVNMGSLKKSYSKWKKDLSENRAPSTSDLLNYFSQNIFKA